MSELKLKKLKMQTPDICEENIKKLKELFPQIVSEDKIDFDILKQLLSNSIVEADDERYRLDWVGKKRSLLKANTPINKTLRPCVEESVDFENTKNLYIEGDNFEVLKLLQESYLNKIKMIYIDPPYNTGKDFVYRDNFTQKKDEFEDEIGLRDEEGNKLFKNTDSNGRFHSDWLSMMYERLIVARDLLKDDGVIFISIDDNEVHNLRKICDEIFGEGNFIAELIIHSNPRGRQSNKYFPLSHEYILVYSKNENNLQIYGLDLTDEQKKEYSLSDEKGVYRELGLRLRGGRATAEESPTLHFPLYYDEINDILYIDKKENCIEIIPKFSDGTLGTWRWSKDKIITSINELNVRKVNGLDGERYDVFQKDYLSEDKKRKSKSLWMEKEINYDRSKDDLKNIKLDKVFDYSKPSYLIEKLCFISTLKDDIILDFFSGSATTAHAVMQLNAQDGGNRKFIMVQIPEKTDDKDFPTICEIGKERIRRAGKKIVEESGKTDLDIGFRVLKVDSSNMKDVYYHPADLKQSNLLDFETNIKEDRNDLDLLFSIMLDLGITLDLKITTKTVDDKKLYIIENSELVVCFENSISLEVIEFIKKEKPLKVVLKDGCFENDTKKINAINELSLITNISVI